MTQTGLIIALSVYIGGGFYYLRTRLAGAARWARAAFAGKAIVVALIFAQAMDIGSMPHPPTAGLLIAFVVLSILVWFASPVCADGHADISGVGRLMKVRRK